MKGSQDQGSSSRLSVCSNQSSLSAVSGVSGETAVQHSSQTTSGGHSEERKEMSSENHETNRLQEEYVFA